MPWAGADSAPSRWARSWAPTPPGCSGCEPIEANGRIRRAWWRALSAASGRGPRSRGLVCGRPNGVAGGEAVLRLGQREQAAIDQELHQHQLVEAGPRLGQVALGEELRVELGL